MAARKFSISLTQELASALDALAHARGDDRSRLLETLLREHPLVQGQITKERGASTPESFHETVGGKHRLVGSLDRVPRP